jgi:hypothetical protein
MLRQKGAEALTEESPRKNARKTRGKPFAKGNSGRPRGSRNKTTLAVQALFEGEGEALTRKTIELAHQGNLVALKMCQEQYAPPRRDRPVPVAIPVVRTAQDAVDASSAIVKAAAEGEISLSEAGLYQSLLIAHQKMVEIVNHEERIKKLEQQAAASSGKARDMTSEDRAELLGRLVAEAIEKQDHLKLRAPTHNSGSQWPNQLS